MLRRLGLLPLLCMLILMTGCSSLTTTAYSPETHPLSPELSQRIDAYIQQKMQENKVPGLGVGIIKNNEVAYARGYGVINIKTGEKVTSQTIFQMGSDAKMMVGISVMQLIEQGKLDLDAPVTQFLPYFKMADERYKQITLRYMMSHRSGIPYCITNDRCDFQDYQAPEYDDGSLERETREAADVKLNNEPGKVMEYSDLGVEIVGDVIAKMSGENFEAYIQNHIINPLGMKHSTYLLTDVPPNTLAQPHVEKDGVVSLATYYPYSRRHGPSSHLFSNVDDIMIYAKALLKRNDPGALRLASENSFNMMWTPQIETNMPSPWEKNLGLGWFLGGYEGHRLVGHAGGDTGFCSEFILAPEDGLAIVVMVNNEYQVEELSFQIMQWLLQEKMHRLQ